MSIQNRASPKYILRWIAALDIEDILIENVPEFADWGPLHRSGPRTGLPIRNRKGEYFNRFVQKIEQYGYKVKWRVLNAADYGDPTTRKRLFVIARKHKPVTFPEPTHGRQLKDLFGELLGWRPAREIIDWTLKGESIFDRKRPLSPNTMRRIMAGLQKFGGKAFVIGQQSGAAPRDVDEPIPTVAGAGAISLVQPFIVPQFSHGQPKSVDEPLGVITTTSRGIGLVQPFLVTTDWGKTNRMQPRSVDEPVPTVIGQHNRIGLVEPFLMAVNHGSDDKRSYSLEEPMKTVTSVDAWGLVEPFIVMLNGTDESHIGSSQRSVEEPVPTVTAKGNHLGVAEPFLVPYHTEREGQGPRVHSINDPMPTVTTENRFALVQPFLVEYHGTGGAHSVDEPLKTQTGKDRFGLAQPMIVEDAEGKRYKMDILFRMLKPHELAAAMSFPKDYRFSGTREQVVKQIGNAVPVRLAHALTATLLGG
jgi:DNA (cytosine-5)-methyltransferase 1